ncbi:hypothetical protein RD792_007784 [Penstemon davidsonii]|uniref:F-box domain-containing protein n=1 Tax=Penstemon davidsonii TaxID=160366 RepID=A0ABR0D8Q0_9LAMI|nr:hypothetical protein RD792_007784 [Penstemon davidsonii]
MAFGKTMKRGNEGYGMGLVRSTSFGRKRVAFSRMDMDFGENDEFLPNTPLKRQRSEGPFLCTEKPGLENLPQEILIRIICGVEHDDLKRLFFVSKSIREATLIAKQSHFAYNTPKKTLRFAKVDEFGDFNEEVEAPNAPKQCRVPRSRLTAKKLADISVALFSLGTDEDWPRRDLIAEMEMVI